jgi:hypothetical protein
MSEILHEKRLRFDERAAAAAAAHDFSFPINASLARSDQKKREKAAMMLRATQVGVSA